MPENETIPFIGFGEAAAAFAIGWGQHLDRTIRAYDIKTDNRDEAVRSRKWNDYAAAQASGCATLEAALEGAPLVFSLVTADQALAAAENAAKGIEPNTLYLDCNSCAPGTKRLAAEQIERAGERYVDVAVMAPVHPALHKTPLLLSGSSSTGAHKRLAQLEMHAEISPGDVGASSSVKMIRSTMVKGLESLVAECTLAGRRAGVEETVFATLDRSFPGFGWRERASHMLERMMTHGERRAAEMREVAKSVEALGLTADMTHASGEWQQRIGDLALTSDSDDYQQLADQILNGLNRGVSEE